MVAILAPSKRATRRDASWLPNPDYSLGAEMTLKPTPQPPNAAPPITNPGLDAPRTVATGRVNDPSVSNSSLATPQAQGMPEEPDVYRFYHPETNTTRFVARFDYDALRAYAERLEAELKQVREGE